MSRFAARRPARVAALLAVLAASAWWAGPGGVALAQGRKPGKKYALLVGVDRYRKGALLPGLGDSPLRDIEGLAEVLVEIGYAKDDIVVMTPTAEDLDLQPYAEPVRNQLDLMLKALGKGDSVLVMLVGHGVMMEAPPPGGGKPVARSFFCPMDANLVKKNLDQFIALDKVFDALKTCEAMTKLLLVDACRNELRAAPPKWRAAGIAMPAPPLPPPSVAALYSCSEKEVSWQDSALGGGHGVFSHFIIEGLKDAKADAENGNRDGEVTLDELTGYVRQNVFRFVRARHATSQMPRLLGDIGIVVLRDRISARSGPVFLTSRASGMKLKLIPAGTFWMGSSKDDDKDAFDDEIPRHEVRISRAFYLGVTEVTQGQYRAVTGESPSRFKGSDDLPVENVTWNDAIAFCNKLSEREGLKPYYRFGAVEQSSGDGYRLPTEAEWEYACRAGNPGRYSFGDDASALGDHAWYYGNSGDKTHPVGQKLANKFGLFDTHGNVWEWCWDGYDAKYYAGSPESDPSGPLRAAGRVIRGGSWYDIPRYAQSASRSRSAPGGRPIYLGFRVARGRSGQ